jgi:hypothetical protein
VEFGLGRAQSELFLDCYRRESGDDASSRFRSYAIAYSAFRVGSMKLALLSADGDERRRLTRAARRYRAQLRAYVC